MTPLRLTVLLLMIWCTRAPWTVAQCCSGGSPIGGTSNLGILSQGKTKLIVSYSYSYLGQAFEGSRRIESNLFDAGHFHFINANVSFGLFRRLTAEFDAGLFHSRLQGASIPSNREKNAGLGSIDLALQYNVYRNRPKYLEITTGVGIRYATSEIKQTYRGTFLAADQQPVTGTPDFFHSLFLYKGFPHRHLHFFLTSRIELKGRDTDGYHYGNLYTTSLFASYSLGLRWDLILQARSEIRARDARDIGEFDFLDGRSTIIITGSKKLFLVPQISYTLSPSLSLTTLVDIPVYQHYNGQQLGNSVTFGLAVIQQLGSRTLIFDAPFNGDQ